MKNKRILSMLCIMVGLISACNNTQDTTNIELQDTITVSEANTVIDSTEQIYTRGETSILETESVDDIIKADATIIAEIFDTYQNIEEWIGVEIRYADLNADGVDELFVTHYEYVGVSFCGWLSVYDVTSSAVPIVKVCISNVTDAGLYKDAENQIHYIVRGDWWGQSDSYFFACYDITSGGLTVPLCGIANWWYDPGYECNFAVYKNVDYDVENGYTYGNYGFVTEEENFVGYIEQEDVKGATATSVDSAEFTQLLYENVYADMEYIDDVTVSVTTQKNNGSFETDIGAVISQHYAIELE